MSAAIARPELRAALRRTVRDMGLRPRGLVVDWEAELEVGGPRGRLRVQVSGTVPNRRAGIRRDEVLAERFLADGLEVAAVAAEGVWGDPKAVERRIQRWLAARMPSKGLRAALVDCPVAPTR